MTNDFTALIEARKIEKRREREAARRRSSPPVPAVATGATEGNPYGLKALREEAATLAAAPAGERNIQLYNSALKLGRHVAAGSLRESDVRAALAAAVDSFGDWPSDSRSFDATYQSGLNNGMDDPRYPPPREPIPPATSFVPPGDEGAAAAPAGSLTDDGNAARIIQAYGDVIRRVSDMGSWWHWDGRRWDRDHDDAHVREAAKRLARELPAGDRAEARHKRASMSSAGLTAAVRVAQSDPRVTVLAREMDRHPEVINTPSGVLNLRDGTVTPHDPALMLTRITAAPVDLDGAHPGWDAFLKETFDGDDTLIGYVRRLCGLALLGDVRDHVLPFFYGAGANGKGVLLLVLQGLLGIADTGGYAVSAPDGFLMASSGTTHPTDIARLRGARLVVCSEQTSGRRFDEARVKRLTGGDLLTGRFMRGDFFDFTPSHLIVVASNHLPEVREGGPAFWRRVRLIPFDHVVPPERRNPELHTRLLDTEGPAILGWMARGAADVVRDGLGEPERVMAATEDYRVSEDSLASFVRDQCLTGEHYWCSVADFRARYEAHCAELGTEPLSAKALGMRLTREFPVIPERKSRPARRIYRGIGLAAADGPGDDG